MGRTNSSLMNFYCEVIDRNIKGSNFKFSSSSKGENRVAQPIFAYIQQCHPKKFKDPQKRSRDSNPSRRIRLN